MCRLLVSRKKHFYGLSHPLGHTNRIVVLVHTLIQMGSVVSIHRKLPSIRMIVRLVKDPFALTRDSRLAALGNVLMGLRFHLMNFLHKKSAKKRIAYSIPGRKMTLMMIISPLKKRAKLGTVSSHTTCGQVCDE